MQPKLDKVSNFRSTKAEYEGFCEAIPDESSPGRIIRKLMKAYTRYAAFQTAHDPRVEAAAQEVAGEEQ